MPGVNVARGFFGGNSDSPRDQIPPGQMYRIKDYIPGLVSAAEKRGGWSYVTPALKPISAGWTTQSARSAMIGIEVMAGAATPAAASVASGSTTASTTLTLAGATPTANTLYILSVASNTPTGTAAAPSSVSDTSGLTWTLITTVADGSHGSLSQYRAQKPSGLSSRSIVVTYAGQQGTVAALLDSFTSATTGGTDGSAAIVQTAVPEGPSNSKQHGTSVLMPAIAQASNAYYAAAYHVAGEATVPSPYLTELQDLNATNISIESQWVAGDFSPNIQGMGFYEEQGITNNEYLVVWMSDGSMFYFDTLDGTTHPNGGAKWANPTTALDLRNNWTPMVSDVVLWFANPLQAFTTHAAVDALGSTDHDMSSWVYESWMLFIGKGDIGFLDLYVPDAGGWSPWSGSWVLQGIGRAVAVLRGIILYWGSKELWGISGTVPPVGGDWTALPSLGSAGILDARTVVNYNSQIYWAGPAGIYSTDGGGITDLTKQAQYLNRWKEITEDYAADDGDTAVAGIYRGYYVVSVNNSGTYYTLLLDTETGRIIEFTNIEARTMLTKSSSAGVGNISGEEELWFAVGNRVAAFSGMWSASSANKQDGDGTDVLPVIETPYYRLSATQAKRVRAARVDMDIEAASGTPYIQPSFITNPTDTSYTDAPETLTETTTERRRRFSIRRKTYGVAFKLTQVGASDRTSIHSIDIEGHQMDEAR